MRLEFSIGGRLFVVEAEGAVSVRVTEEEETFRLGASMDARAEGFFPEPPEDAPFAGEEEGLFAALAVLRKKIAMEAGIPPYMVFKDSALYEMARERPKDIEDFSLISGVGKAKLEKYGDVFLSAIREVSAE